MTFFSAIFQLAYDNLFLIGVVSAVMFVGSLIALPVIIISLPEGYFLESHSRWQKRKASVSFALLLQIVFLIGKNGVGIILLMAGIMMLFLPGQGIVTLVIALSLLDFPGKHALEQRLVGLVSVQKSMNWIRKKYQRPPLLFTPTSGCEGR